MPMVLVVLASVTAIPILLMIATCLLGRVESALIPRARRVVRTASVPSAGSSSAGSSTAGGSTAGQSPVGSSRHLRLVPDDDHDGPVDHDVDPDATAQLRWVS